MDQLLNIDFGYIFGRLSDVVRDPGADPRITWMLIAVLTLAVLIVLLLGVTIIAGGSDDEDEWEEGEYWDDEPEDRSAQYGDPRRARVPIAGLAITLALGSLIWVATGVFMSQNALCISCHSSTPHGKVQGGDPHGTATCVACHEPGGTVGSVTYMVAPRAIHFAWGVVATQTADGYSRTVPSSACLSCHAGIRSGVITIQKQGVRVSHKEPLAGGAQCVDCHTISGGTVSSRTVGMSACLRCHDGKQAKSSCGTCHTTDIANAVRPSGETTVGPQNLIETPDCYACHDPKPCDTCHGIRLPHTPEFLKHGHARQAAMDIWFNGGKVCVKCHTAGRRPCTECHARSMPQHASPVWATEHQYGNPTNCSQGCHGYRTGGGTRTMCEFCHDAPIEPKKKPPSPIPTSILATRTGG